MLKNLKGLKMLDQNSSQVELLTIGYEGVKIEEFLDTLLEAEVTVLLDIRELPLSRKKGFSKNLYRRK